mmetsp:Transcript_320/g.495  ORF Transcript_320/g.495 Transcript_320/m.495 type:complete len:224 (+) Transcript_320:92-763(+)
MKRWKVEIAGQRDAVLQLSAVNLPGGVQRMRTYEDQLSMRTLFSENDLVSAEIQNINSEGIVSLHTRSFKYGKLENGQLIIVPCALVKRLPQHFVSLSPEVDVDVTLGKNGYIWITRTIPRVWKQQEEAAAGLGTSIGPGAQSGTPLAETAQNLQRRHTNTPLLKGERAQVVRIRNCISVLASRQLLIYPDSIKAMYTASLHLQPKDIMTVENIDSLVQKCGF